MTVSLNEHANNLMAIATTFGRVADDRERDCGELAKVLGAAAEAMRRADDQIESLTDQLAAREPAKEPAA